MRTVKQGMGKTRREWRLPSSSLCSSRGLFPTFAAETARGKPEDFPWRRKQVLFLLSFHLSVCRGGSPLHGLALPSIGTGSCKSSAGGVGTRIRFCWWWRPEQGPENNSKGRESERLPPTPNHLFIVVAAGNGSFVLPVEWPGSPARPRGSFQQTSSEKE